MITNNVDKFKYFQYKDCKLIKANANGEDLTYALN